MMMTFLVYADFRATAQVLDNARLGKQRLECFQILNAIAKIEAGVTKGAWINHPAVRAWIGHTDALKFYANCMIEEFTARGFKNTMSLYELPDSIDMPWWVTWDRLHQSHRAMLLRKDPFFYSDKFEIEPEYHNHGYIWPTEITNVNAPLADIAAPIPKELLNAAFCTALLKSGARSGQTCNRLIKDGSDACGVHRKTRK